MGKTAKASLGNNAAPDMSTCPVKDMVPIVGGYEKIAGS